MTSISPVSKHAERSPLREGLQLCGVHLRYALFFSALVNVAYLAPTLYMLGVYDMVVPSGSELTLAFFTGAMCLTLLVLTYLDKVRIRILSAASVRLDNVFSTRIFRQAMLNPAQGPQSRVNQMIREADIIRAAVTGPAALAFMDAPWTPIYILVCFFLHPAIGGLALAGCLILLGLAIWNERITRNSSRKALDASAASFAAQEAAGAGADVIRSLGMTDAFVKRFETARRSAHLPQLEAAHATGRIGGFIRFLRLLLQSVALGLGAWLVIHKQLSAGSIFAASMLASRALAPMDQIVAQWRTVSQALTAYTALETHLAEKPDPIRTQLPPPRPMLIVDKVSLLTPKRDRLLLREISFQGQPGQVIGVIGQSGAGKSTLLQILGNARAPDQGSVRIDGARYDDWSSQALGQHIGYLPQDHALFPGTVKENISRFQSVLGVDATMIDAKAIAAARAAGVHELILGLSGGYDTPIGMRGMGLSAGQQQRIALARALFDDPSLLVFDEPNSNLDGEGEAALTKAILGAKARGALLIVAAHRTNIIGLADMLLVLNEGRVERFGPRQEVMDSFSPPPSAGPRPRALTVNPGLGRPS
jgi:ATP-binding cassette subfamily C protein